MKRSNPKDQTKTRTSLRTTTRSRKKAEKAVQPSVTQPEEEVECNTNNSESLPFNIEGTLFPIRGSQILNDKLIANPLETPKHSLPSAVCKKTPTGPDEGFINNFSQHDPNRLVVWDCSSPEAVSFIRHKRRRRHASDVSDIVQNLIIPEEDEEDDIEKESLLGKWLETKPLGPDLVKADRNSSKQGKKKEKGKRHKKDNNLQNDLLQKLQQALVDASDGQNNEEKDEKSARNCSQRGLDGSRDLFESVLESGTTGKKSDRKSITGQSDTSWSEDDFFDNDSFIIKATQNPEEFFNSKQKNSSSSKKSGSHKRKTSGNSVEDQPQKKVVKYGTESPKVKCLRQKPPVPSSRINHSDKNSLKADVIQNKKNTRSSPFRKFRSFEDDKKGGSSYRQDNMQKIKPVNASAPFLKKNEVVKVEPVVPSCRYNSNNRANNYHNQASSAVNKPANSPVNNKQTGSCVNTKPTGSCVNNKSTASFVNNKPTGSVNNIPTSSCVNNKPTGSYLNNKSTGSCVNKPLFNSQNPNTNQKTVSVPNPKNQAFSGKHNPSSSCMNTKPSYCSQVPSANQKVSNAGKIENISGTRGFSVHHNNPRSNFPTKPCGSFYKAGSSNDQISSSQTYSQFKNMKSQMQNPNTGSAKSESTGVSRNLVSQTSTVDSLKQRLSESSAIKKEVNKRRSAGNLDTSLSDDLLCQLAESDEVLDSQVPKSQVSKVKEEQSDRRKGANYPGSSESSKPVACVSPIGNKQFNSRTTFSIKTEPAEKSVKSAEVPNTNKKTSTQKTFKFKGKSPESKDSRSSSSLSSSTAWKNADSVKSKFTFKQTASQVSGTGASKGPVTVKKENSETVRTEAAIHPPDSEDLFTSDEDDGLSEPQILALLDDVELKATQADNSDAANRQNDRGTCSTAKPTEDSCRNSQNETLLSADVDNGPSNSQPSSSQSPFKCTPDEIEQKRRTALSKLKKKSSVSKTPESEDGDSPFKCSGESVDRAIKVVTPNKKSGSSSSSSVSPNKCSPSEIEQKRKAALARRRQKSGMLHASPNLNDGANVTSPSKLLQEEIERKKQAALKLREERQRATRNLTSSLSSCSSKPLKR